MSTVVTGATGKLGGLVVDALLERGIPANQIVAGGRNADRLKELQARGVRTARIDLNDRDSLRRAFRGADKLLLVSGTETGQRVRQHRNAISAANDAGVGLVAYTSIVRADSTTLILAAEHRATEDMLRESQLPFVFLRHSWYMENYTSQIPVYLRQRAILGCADDGRVSAATHADLAGAAAAVLTSEGLDHAVYELGGDDAFTMSELAAEISTQTGQTVQYQDFSVDAYTKLLVRGGVPPADAALIADGDRGVAAGELLVETGDLSRLIGRPTERLSEAIADTLASRTSNDLRAN
jgi:NAD(P)H dehydrogenase (quinone)